MFKTIYIVLALLLAATAAAGQGVEGLSDDERETLAKALERAERGDAKAVTALSELHRNHKENYVIAYELGYALLMTGRAKEAASLFHTLRSHAQADDQTYQMEGNSWSQAGDIGKATAAYRAGLQRYPRSGRLHNELGTLCLRAGEYAQAIEHYETGTTLDATHPSNYYRAAWMHMHSNVPADGLPYAEAFMILEPKGERFQEISALYTETLRQTAAKTAEARTQDTLSALLKSSLLDIGIRSETAFAISLSTLAKARWAMHSYESEMADTEGWGETAADIVRARVSLFREEVMRAGHWEAYSMWQTRAGDSLGFNAWMQLHDDRMERFAEWFGKEGQEIIKMCFR